MENQDKDSLQYVAQMALTAGNKRIVTINDTKVGQRTFLIHADGDVAEFRPDDGAQQALRVHTLAAVVDYITRVTERQENCLIVEIRDQDIVEVYGLLDDYGHRELLMRADALHPDFQYGRFLDQESFNIAIQSQFVPTDDSALILKFVGNLKQENTKTSTDDGVTQVATVKTGVTTVEDAIVPNPVSLKPFRTFVEVDQPESEFVFRVSDQMEAALFAADGGKWRNEAITNIAEYLANGLSDVSNRVTILS